MIQYGTWCTQPELTLLDVHKFGTLESHDDAAGVGHVAAVLPSAYADTSALALVAERHGKSGVAAFLRNRLPTKKSARSGDMGEILATAYLHEDCGYVVGPSRLVDRDHQEWAMRGDDVLAARIEGESDLYLVKAEAKSGVAIGETTVMAAREGLARNEEMPSPHSLSQFATRLLPTPDHEIGEAVIDLQMTDGVRPQQVGHVMFLFTGGDPSVHVKKDLDGYRGTIRQRSVTLRVRDHQRFINEAYDAVVSGAP
ncbi:hypothetical protein [Paenarthrobacter ureafaciens]|uniref:hypothetical protein n=1 Tax=Paenarthrobacter ureafaciens TaxID=37931 RepID=UPI002DB7DF02|nr:hypothetical protein [Paenarthrobacter ureafaciens]MEC3853983.1 hypothetical protein [Paenarthrobacter ureafaciens]